MERLQLVTLPTSPFSARIRIQAYEKGIDLDLAPPPGGMGSDALRALNPFGKIPVLTVGNETIVESAAIQEYLEDVYPTQPLRGPDPLTAAKVRGIVRAIDLYFFPALATLRGLPADSGDPAPAVAELGAVVNRLGALCGDQGYLCGSGLTLADCTLVPARFYAGRFVAPHGIRSPFEEHRTFRDWWDIVTQHESVRRVVAELDEALARRK